MLRTNPLGLSLIPFQWKKRVKPHPKWTLKWENKLTNAYVTDSLENKNLSCIILESC